MNVLMVTPWYKPTFGGVVSAVERISKGLIKSGNRVTIFVPGDNITIEQISTDEEMRVYSGRLRTPLIKITRVKPMIGWLLGLIPTIIRLRKFLRLNKIDIIALHFPGPEYCYFRFLKLLFDVKYVVCIHGHDIEAEAKNNHYIRFWVKSLCRRSDAVIACSNYLLGEARLILGKLPPKSLAIHLGIDPNWADSAPSKHYDLPLRYIVANIAPPESKGGDIVIKAFGRLDSIYDEVKLVLLGKIFENDETHRLVEKLGLAKRIIRLGSIPNGDVPHILKRAEFGVAPSRKESFGQVSLELQLVKKVIIASNVGGFPESIINGVTGFLIPSEDDKALAEKMADCLSNPVLCKKIGEAAHDHIIANFSVDQTAIKYKHLFGKILAT